MPITIHGNDLNLKKVSWDHLLTDHGLEGCDATRFGWQRKSKWYGDEGAIETAVNAAFDAFRQSAIRAGTVTLEQDPYGRSVSEVDMGSQCGTGIDGKATTRVRLVMELKHSGDTTIVTAFPW